MSRGLATCLSVRPSITSTFDIEEHYQEHTEEQTVGIREAMNKNPGVSAAIIGVVILIAGVLIYRQMSPPMDAPPAKAFFSTDDGATYFVDDIAKLAPFQKDGKEAVRVHVCECDGKQMVVYLEKYTPQAKSALEKAASGTGDRAAWTRMEIEENGRLVKKPKAAKWEASNTPAARMITATPKCNGADARWVDAR